VEDVVTVRDVAAVVQRGEMVRQIAAEIETMIIELGVDARLLRLQLDELYGEIGGRSSVTADYPTITGNYAGSRLDSDAASPRGLRLLAQCADDPTASAVSAWRLTAAAPGHR
jgi:diadenylate cyclase